MTTLEACAEWLADYRAQFKDLRSANMSAILGMYGDHNAPGLSELKRAVANAISVALSLSAASVEQTAELKRLRVRVEELEKR